MFDHRKHTVPTCCLSAAGPKKQREKEISTRIDGLKSNEQFIQFRWQVGFRVP